MAILKMKKKIVQVGRFKDYSSCNREDNIQNLMPIFCLDSHGHQTDTIPFIRENSNLHSFNRWQKIIQIICDTF